MIVEFGEWLPDLPVFNNEGATVAKNVIPAGNSYRQLSSLSVYSGALSAICRGAIAGRDPTTGSSVNFAGDATKLYKMASAAWSNVSKSGGYNLGADQRWYFTQFGNQLIATNLGDNIQSFTIGTSSAFADLSSSAPKARYISNLRNFVAVANTFDSVDGNVPHRVRWSGIGAPTSWTVSATTQSDFQDLNASYGWCTQIVGGEYGVVFQERAITRMTYVGSPVIFQFDVVEQNKGTQAPGSVIKVGNMTAYLGIDGFYLFDGTQSIPIGVNKVDKFFFSDVDNNYLYNISAAVDYTNHIIAWAYPGSGNTAGRCNKILFYNYAPDAQKRWSFAEVDTEFLYSSLAEGYTLDQLDTISSNLDLLPFSLDSRVYTGNQLLLSAFDSNHKLNNFTGAAMAALLETLEAEISPGNRTHLMQVRPLVDGSGSTITVQMGTRNLLTDTVSYASAVSVDSIGNCNLRSNARYHRARVNISGGFTHAQGIDVTNFRKAGVR